MEMEPPVGIQVENDEEGKRDVLSESRSRSPDNMLQATRKLNRSEAADTPCLGSSSSSSSCSIDADEGFADKRRTGSTAAEPAFDAVSCFMRGRTAKLKGPDVIKEPKFTGTDFEKHPTTWKPWPPSRNTYVGRGGGFHRPLHEQHSTPEEMLRVRNREGWDFLHPRKSGKIQLRSLSFPPGPEKCADSCVSTTSLGTLTTVASSLSGSSVFSCFSRLPTDLTATLKSAELKSASAPERTLGRSQMLQRRHLAVYDPPTASCDEFPPDKASSSLNADLDTSLSSGRSDASVDGKHSENPLQRIFESIQGSPENRRTVAHPPQISHLDCGSVRKYGDGSPQGILSSHLSSAASSKTSESLECTDALSYSTSKSLWSFYPPLALTTANSFTTPLSASKGAAPPEACSDRPLTVAGEATSPVESQLAVSLEPYVNLGHASALPCSGSAADRDATVTQPFEGGDRSVRRTSLEASLKGTADPEQLCLSEERRLETQGKAELWRCPNAPHLSYVPAPTTHIPELILGDGVLVPPAVGGVLTDAKHAVAVDEHTYGESSLRPAR